MENKNHVITRNNVEQKGQKSTQSDVVIPNKLSNGEVCQGLRHWRLLSNLKNSFSKPVRNDMGRHPEVTRAEDVRLEPYPFNASVKCPKDLQTLGSRFFAFAQNDVTTCAPLVGEPKSLISKGGKNVSNCNQEPSPEFVSSPQLTNKFYPLTKREGKKNGKGLINLSTYQLIDLKKKFAFTLAEVLITLGVIGVVAAITIPGLMTKYHRSVVEKKLIKFESIMNQAIRMSIAENDDLVFSPPENVSERAPYMKEWLQENLLKFMKAEYDGEVISNKYYKISFVDGTGVVVYPADKCTRIHFFFCLESKDATCKPESYDGRNTFVFVYDQPIKAVLPYGYNVNDVNKLKNSKGSTNVGCYTTIYPTHRHYCAQLIKQNGWKIPDDYPWIK